eukprot:CAMPEP_0117549694 /NCGR_PEP_ID=MMETSP0784-20121206/48297_1 /TAXON_ID=39447 /ORGANISM="" /LENGTH=233 /DNA_ID=CAMNT_0005346689 /DNA_START=69 /DNA_END=770 /DNA_ORIENTATION=-
MEHERRPCVTMEDLYSMLDELDGVRSATASAGPQTNVHSKSLSSSAPAITPDATAFGDMNGTEVLSPIRRQRKTAGSQQGPAWSPSGIPVNRKTPVKTQWDQQWDRSGTGKTLVGSAGYKNFNPVQPPQRSAPRNQWFPSMSASRVPMQPELARVSTAPDLSHRSGAASQPLLSGLTQAGQRVVRTHKYQQSARQEDFKSAGLQRIDSMNSSSQAEYAFLRPSFYVTNKSADA